MTFLARTAPSSTSGERLLDDARTAARTVVTAALTPSRLSLARAGAGGVMLVRPGAVGRLLGVEPGALRSTGFAVQMLGVREIALGLGAAAALRTGDARVARGWLLAGLLCDAVDAVVVAGAVGRGRVRPAPGAALIAVATTAAAVQGAALPEGD